MSKKKKVQKERPNCMHCGKPADYICNKCGVSAICEEEDDSYCTKCGEEEGYWEEL
ncbi:MAG: hypothetical protein ACFFD4_08495 [Candidatus Odinarchaeota archaeon]